MKKLVSIFLLALVAISFTSCYKDPVQRQGTDNVDVPVELIFTVDSCKVYRFRDGGRAHYIVIGQNAIQTMSVQHSGKHTYTETIQTVK
jgi:hypothetical protein